MKVKLIDDLFLRIIRQKLTKQINQQIKKLNIHHSQLFWEEVGCVWL